MLFSLSANIHIMHIWSLLLVTGDRNRWSNGWLGNLMNFYTPFILWLFEVCQPELWLSVWDYEIGAIFAEDSMNLWYHFLGVSGWVLATLDIISSTKTESKVALSTMASNEDSGKSIALTSIRRYLKFYPFSLYFYFIALTQTLEISIFVIFV